MCRNSNYFHWLLTKGRFEQVDESSRWSVIKKIEFVFWVCFQPVRPSLLNLSRHFEITSFLLGPRFKLRFMRRGYNFIPLFLNDRCIFKRKSLFQKLFKRNWRNFIFKNQVPVNFKTHIVYLFKRGKGFVLFELFFQATS